MRFSALRVLITGGTGLLGVNWAAAMREEHEIWLGTHRRRISLRGTRPTPLEYGSPDAFARAIDSVRPDLIVNAVGLTDVDACERDPERAHEIHARFTANVAQAAARHKLGLVHISTDHLFSGSKSNCDETDAPAPVNAYARSKLEGEREVATRCPGALIVRTNFFAWGHGLRRSLSDWILEGLRAGRVLDMFNDAFFTPILVAPLARAVHALAEAGAAGVYHVTGDERLSKHDFAVRLAVAFSLPRDTIRPCELRSANLAAPRPLDLSLSNAKARQALGRSLGSLDEYLAELMSQERSGRALELRRAVTE